ncbi:MAG TPA: MASE1 domain-containing protein [Gemmatimonadaceae bacterium]|nr:MASE1 domain-containing protein [Gemmatimonadaceae bacterium]
MPLHAGPRVRYIAGVLFVALLYILGAQIGAEVSFVERSVSPVWPPSGIAIAMLLLLGVRYWPGVALGILVETIIGSAPFSSVVLISTGNTLVAVGSVMVLQRLTLGRSPLDRPDDTLRLIVIGLAGPVVAAAIGTFALWSSGAVPASAALDTWRVWWLGDVLGVLVIAPAILAWARPEAVRGPWRTPSFWAMLAGLVGLSLLVFREYIADARVEYPLAYAIIPLVLWMTIRHGHRGGTLATLIVSGIAVLATVRGHGSLAREEMQESLLLVATFSSVMAVTALLVGASVVERRRTETMLRQIIEGTAGVTGGAFLTSLVRHLASALGARWALVAVIPEEARDRARTLALWADGALADGLEYPLAGTPCADCVGLQPGSEHGPRSCHIQSGAAALYPDDALLASMGVDAYLGAPLLDRRGTPIGVLVVMHDRPLPTAGIADSILAIFASRASAELERMRNEEDRRRIDEQLGQTQKLESLGVLAGGVAHDFNNLLAGILGNASLARGEVDEGEDPSESLVQIETAARRAADLTRQMLAYSGRGAFVIQRIDLGALVNEMAGLLASVISKKAVLDLRVPESIPECEGDATQLRQLVMNLITNASDALGDDGGTITVTTGVVEATRAELAGSFIDEQLPEGRYVFLEVRDTGCGMDYGTRARIFDPFFTTKFTGRGLGLAATLGIVRGHRGAITVESAPGAGSAFRLLLPALAPPLARSEPVTGPIAVRAGSPWRGSGRILVVDDEEMVRTLAVRVLEASGFDVLGATDGREAIALFTRSPDTIRLVLLDWMMPHLGGGETLDALRRIRPKVPVILSSGYAEQTVGGRLEDERTVFIQKPYRPQELLAKVRAALA